MESVGNDTDRLSNIRGARIMRSPRRRESSRNAGGALLGRLSEVSRTAPAMIRRTTPYISMTTSSFMLPSMAGEGAGTELNNGTGRYPRFASARPVRTLCSPGRSTTMPANPSAAGAQPKSMDSSGICSGDATTDAFIWANSTGLTQRDHVESGGAHAS
jgi:hypothetical protein